MRFERISREDRTPRTMPHVPFKADPHYRAALKLRGRTAPLKVTVKRIAGTRRSIVGVK